MDIKGKIILITGASSGIGEACAILFAQKGGRVVLQARGEEGLTKVANRIKESGGEAFTYPLDISDHKAVEATAEKIMNEVGVPDVIINNAGIGKWLSIEKTSLEEGAQMMAVPYLGAWYTTRVFIEKMMERNSGHIINMTSVSAFLAFQGAVTYAAARWAMRGFSESLRTDLYHTNIKVSLLAPGKVDSPYFNNNPGSAEQIPKIYDILYKTLTTEEVAKLAYGLTQRYRKILLRPRFLALTIWFQRFMPWVIEKLTTSTGVDRTKS